MEVRQASFYLYLETSLESCHSVELWPRCAVVPLFTIGNRGYLVDVILSIPEMDGEMGEEARDKWGEDFLHTEWITMRLLCHPICGANLELTAYLFPFSEASMCFIFMSPCARWGVGHHYFHILDKEMGDSERWKDMSSVANFESCRAVIIGPQSLAFLFLPCGHSCLVCAVLVRKGILQRFHEAAFLLGESSGSVAEGCQAKGWTWSMGVQRYHISPMWACHWSDPRLEIENNQQPSVINNKLILSFPKFM